MEKSSGPLISIKGLQKFYKGNHILKGIDLEVKSGELISVIGRSGCGKTTLLRCLNCLEILDRGTIHIAGVTLNRKSPSQRKKGLIQGKKPFRKKGKPFTDMINNTRLDEDFRIKANAIRMRVGLLFQNLNLFPHLTVLENIVRPQVVVRKEKRDQAVLRAIQLLEKVGLEKFTSRYPSQLSGGQAQRVAIARALAMSPQVMLYDEPTSALDPELVEEVLQVMRNLHQEGMTQIVVTHAMRFAKNASDRLIYMEDGYIVEDGPPGEIFSNPKDDRTRQYLNIVSD